MYLIFVILSNYLSTIPSCMSAAGEELGWPKEGLACFIAQRQRILPYDFLKNKKFDVKKLIPKILEEFTIVIAWSLQMLGLNGSR